MKYDLSQEIAKLNQKRRRQKNWKKIVRILVCVVVFCTTYALILPAITMEEKTYCGLEAHHHDAVCFEQRLVCGMEETEGEPHVHTDACYEQEKMLICQIEESEEHTHTEECYSVQEKLICGLEEGEQIGGHAHTDSCYQKILICDKQEHEHTINCYSDPQADIESAEVWEKSLAGVELTGIWSEDVIAVAESQLGYTESSRNYQVTEDGRKKGYTRYGAWYGDSYGDWCAMFVSFCLNYAEIPEEAFPWEANCRRWTEILSTSAWDRYHDAGEYTPVKGDIVFFDNDADGSADHVGLVRNWNEDVLTVIEGNCSNCVQSKEYQVDDTCIIGYGVLPENDTILSAEEEPAACIQTLTALIYTDETYQTLSDDTAEITVTGELPEGAEALAFPVTIETEMQVLCAYDIAIRFPDGSPYEPAEGESVSVEIRSAEVDAMDEKQVTEVYYIPQDGEPEYIESWKTDEGLSFETNHFSVYAVTAAVTVLSSDTIPAKTENSDYWQSAVYPYYQCSNYGLHNSARGAGGYEWVDTFVLVPRQSAAYSWTPNPTDWTASSNANYIVVYCAELTVLIDDDFNTPYHSFELSTTSLSNSQKEALAAIIQHSYPFISKEQAIANMQNAGYTLSGCTENELLSATQWAIWDITEDGANTCNGNSVSVVSSHVSNVKSKTVNPLDTVSSSSTSGPESRIQSIHEYLQSCTSDKAGLTGIEITDTQASENGYTMTVQISLSRALESGESGSVAITTDTGITTTVDIPTGVTSFEVTLENLTGMESKISASAQLHAYNVEVYYFDGNNYQDMVGGRLEATDYESNVETVLTRGSTSVSIEKRWADGTAGADGVSVQLYANGMAYGKSVTLSASNDWFYVWTDLPKTDFAGGLINYTVKESPVAGYQSNITIGDAQSADVYYKQVDSITSGNSYVFIADGYGALANTDGDGTVDWVDVTTNELADGTVSSAAVWSYNGKLQSTDGQYLAQSKSGSTYYIVLSSGSSSSVFFVDGKYIKFDSTSGLVFGMESNKAVAESLFRAKNWLTFTAWEQHSKAEDWADTHYIITNTPGERTLPVSFAKYSVSGDGSAPVLIAGADLALYRADETGETIPGTQTAGVLVGRWTSTSGNEASEGIHTVNLSSGTYYLVETTPPAGHSGLSDPIVFNVDADSGQLEITNYPDHKDLVGSVVGDALIPVYNTATYILPETGGARIIPYTVGGILLITIALLLLYRNIKCRGGNAFS